jgi:hypothetical protein
MRHARLPATASAALTSRPVGWSDAETVAIPSTKIRPWYVRETWPAVVGLIVAMLAGAGGIVKESLGQQPSGTLIALIATSLVASVFLGAMKIAQSRYKDAKDDKKESPSELRGPLHVIHRTLAGHKGGAQAEEGWLRLTIHRMDGEQLEQAVDYVGSADRGAGRRFSINVGLVGQVARQQKPVRIDRDPDMTHEQWLAHLIEKFGMTPAQAGITRAGRYSFLGIPLMDNVGQATIGVVYLDSLVPGFFDEGTVAVVVASCAGLAGWIHENYPT